MANGIFDKRVHIKMVIDGIIELEKKELSLQYRFAVDSLNNLRVAFDIFGC